MNTSVFIAVALGIPTGLGLIALTINIFEWIEEKLTEYSNSKTTYIIPDGKGGYIQLPRGVRYEPIAPITKEDN